MRRTKTGFSPSVDVMERRVLLSTAAPLLSKPALSGVVRDVKAIIHTLARTEDTAQASAQLTALSSRIPSGPEGLAPSWQSDIGLYRPHSARSIITTQRRILGDLHRYVQGGIDGGSPPVTGSGSATARHSRPGHGGYVHSGARAQSRQRDDSEHDRPGPRGDRPSGGAAGPAAVDHRDDSGAGEFDRALRFRDRDQCLHDDGHQQGGRGPDLRPRLPTSAFRSRSAATTGRFSRSRCSVPISTSPPSDVINPGRFVLQSLFRKGERGASAPCLRGATGQGADAPRSPRTAPSGTDSHSQGRLSPLECFPWRGVR